MKISVRMEGGLGDHILANRFIPGILDKYPGAEIHLFSDTSGKTLQSDTLLSLYKFYKSRTLLERKSKQYLINSQFGEENYAAHINNINDNQRKHMLSFDKFYNLHIDWMDWIYFDFHWHNYFYHFPKPDYDIAKFHYEKDYIILHLASDNMGNNHRMSKKYINSLIRNIPLCYDIKILSTPSTENFIKANVIESSNIEIISEPLPKVISLTKHSSGIMAIDSGIKYLGYTFNIPTISWAKESRKAHTCPLAFQARWLTFPHLYFPLEHDSTEMVDCLLNLISSNNFFLNPRIKERDLDNTLIRRIEN